MEVKTKEKSKFIDNIAYKNKFQFLVWANENVICQRYFKINGFNESALYSAEFADCLNGVVEAIKEDLKSKSKIYMWYTNMNEPLKTRGFLSEEEAEMYGDEFLCYMISSKVEGKIEAPDGKVLTKEYLEYGENNKNGVAEERPNDGENVFKFAFLIDDKPVFEKVWDGNIYPKFVRNGVDLANNYGTYSKDIMSMSFNSAIVVRMQKGKSNIINETIRKICVCLSNSHINDDYTRECGKYTTDYTINEEKYNQAKEADTIVSPIVLGHTDVKEETKTYNYYSAFEAYRRSWKKKVYKKTIAYYKEQYENMTVEQLESFYK